MSAYKEKQCLLFSRDYEWVKNFSKESKKFGMELVIAKERLETIEKELLLRQARQYHAVLIAIDGVLFEEKERIKLLLQEQRKVIVYAEKATYYEEMQLLQLGILDYQGKDRPLPVLSQRLFNCLLWEKSDKKQVRRFGDFVFELDSKKAYLNEIELALTEKEYQVLSYMIAWPERIIEKEEMIERIWGREYSGDKRTLDTIIKQLRKKILSSELKIITKYGVGYGIARKNSG